MSIENLIVDAARHIDAGAAGTCCALRRVAQQAREQEHAEFCAYLDEQGIRAHLNGARLRRRAHGPVDLQRWKMLHLQGRQVVLRARAHAATGYRAARTSRYRGAHRSSLHAHSSGRVLERASIIRCDFATRASWITASTIRSSDGIGPNWVIWASPRRTIIGWAEMNEALQVIRHSRAHRCDAVREARHSPCHSYRAQKHQEPQ